MEVSGLVSRQVPCFSGAGIDSRSSFPGEINFPGRVRFGGSMTTRRCRGLRLGSGFFDNGHMEYYNSGPRCGGEKKKKEKEMKKKMKFLEGLAKISGSAQIGVGLDLKEGLVDRVQGQLIAEGREALLQQLEQLRAEEKELKRKRKEETAKVKAERMKTMKECESSSSSSSSESSESECGEVIDMKRMRGEATTEPILDGLQPLLTQPSSVATIGESSTGTSTSCGNIDTIYNSSAGISSVLEPSLTRIEVCMGKKCKNSGGVALLEAFESAMGAPGSVVGCKCLGKCKFGPNVRVLNSVDGIEEGLEDSVRNPTNPLYLGVGLEDVSQIVANLVWEDNKDLGTVTAV